MERGGPISLRKSRKASVNYTGKGKVEGVGEGGDGCGGKEVLQKEGVCALKTTTTTKPPSCSMCDLEFQRESSLVRIQEGGEWLHLVMFRM